jgi:hypothetical protein
MEKASNKFLDNVILSQPVGRNSVAYSASFVTCSYGPIRCAIAPYGPAGGETQRLGWVGRSETRYLHKRWVLLRSTHATTTDSSEGKLVDSDRQRKRGASEAE